MVRVLLLLLFLPAFITAEVYKVNMPLSKFRVTSSYGYRTHPIYKTKKYHDGLDLGAPKGTPIYSVLEGHVAFTGHYGKYGKIVVLVHKDFKTTHYAHCASIKAKVGDFVKKGDIIATVGDTGSATGPHLHFEIRQNGEPVDPMGFLAVGSRQ